MLDIRDLQVSIDGQPVLKGLDLSVRAGEVHAILAPGGAGRSTLAHVLAGRDGYVVTGGDVLYQGARLLDLAAEERTGQGIFLAFQHPVEIPGVATIHFLRAALNAQRRRRGQPELDAVDFLGVVRSKLALMGMDESLLYRSVNEDLAEGDRKRNEILQMTLLEPTLALLDESDAGLDDDALHGVAAGINALRSPHWAMILIPHARRLLDVVVPDRVHVLADGRIVRSGGLELADEFEHTGREPAAARPEPDRFRS